MKFLECILAESSYYFLSLFTDAYTEREWRQLHIYMIKEINIFK